MKLYEPRIHYWSHRIRTNEESLKVKKILSTGKKNILLVTRQLQDKHVCISGLVTNHSLRPSSIAVWHAQFKSTRDKNES